MTYFLTVQDFDNKFIHKNKPLKSLDDALAMISPRYLALSEGKLTSLGQRPLSDPQAAFARGPGEGPLMAEMRRSRTAGVDPYRSFNPADANVSYWIAKQPSNSRNQLGR